MEDGRLKMDNLFQRGFGSLIFIGFLVLKIVREIEIKIEIEVEIESDSYSEIVNENESKNLVDVFGWRVLS